MRRFSFGLTICSIGCFQLVAAGALTCAYAESSSETGGLSLIAIPEFVVSNPVLVEIASRTRRVVEEKFNHAESCVLTDAPLASNKYTKFPVAPDLPMWAARHLRSLILGQMSMRQNGTLKLEAKIFDVAEKTATGYQIIFSPEDWQTAANDLADNVVRLSCPDSAPAK
jgi:Tol biopolymer transport system component